MGQVHVFDQRNRRETVIGPQFDLISEHSLPWGPIYHAAPLPDAEHIIVNGVFREPSRIGLPLHMIRGPDIVASFGMIERGSYSLGTMHMLRRVTIDRDGTIFSGNYFDYSVEAWSPSGQRLLGFKRDGLWQPPPGGQPQPLSRETNLWGLLLAMNVDENDRLWVITWAPREDWLSNVSEGVGPDGQTHLRPRDSDASIRRTAIDVIDLGSGRLVAHRQYDELLYGFLGNRSVFGNRFTSAGEPRLVIWKVDLKEREQ
jgi:hypothetical protein